MNNCKACQYCRPSNEQRIGWCSNSKSPKFRYINAGKVGMASVEKWVDKHKDTCDHFVQKNRKAPLWMRFMSKRLTGLKLSRSKYGFISSTRGLAIMAISFLTIFWSLIFAMLYFIRGVE